MGSTSTTTKTHHIFSSLLGLTFDPYILIHIPSVMFEKPVDVIENHKQDKIFIFVIKLTLGFRTIS